MPPQKRELTAQSLLIYEKALAAYERRDMAAAVRHLREMQALAGGQSLRSLLLEAYIARDGGRPLTEIRTLQRAVELYGHDE